MWHARDYELPDSCARREGYHAEPDALDLIRIQAQIVILFRAVQSTCIEGAETLDDHHHL